MKSDKSTSIINKITTKTIYKSNLDFKLFLGRTSAITATAELKTKLVKDFNIPVDDVNDVTSDILTHMSKECVKTDKDDEIYVDVITATATDKSFFSRLKFTTDKGHKVWMVRTNTDDYTVSILESKTVDITYSYTAILSKFGAYNKYARKYNKIVKDDPYSLAIIENLINNGTDKQTTFTAPHFEEYLSKTLKIIGADEYMFVDKLPVSVSNNPKTPCFYYFNPDILKQGEWGRWKEFIDRFPTDDHRRVFMEWFYMIFLEGVVCEQKMYIQGEGSDGKSTINRVIANKMGSSCYTVQSGSLKGNHWGAKVYDKRLVIHSDSKNPKPLDNEKSHLATDIIDVEKKYEGGFTYQANYMELFMSNDTPEISDVKNERRRLIYIPLGKMSDEQLKSFCKLDENGEVILNEDGDFAVLGNTDYEDVLHDQWDAFLYECKTVYDENNNGKNNNVYIPKAMEKMMFEDIIDGASEFVYITTAFINESNDKHIKAHDLKSIYDGTNLNKEIKSYNAFIRLLQLKYPNMKKCTIHPNDGKAYKAYKGIGFDSEFESDMTQASLDKLDDIKSRILTGRKPQNKFKKFKKH